MTFQIRVTSCSWAVSWPILYMFKFMSMILEKHHLHSWSNKCSLLSLTCFPDSNPSQNPLPHILETGGNMGNISILVVKKNHLVKMVWHKQIKVEAGKNIFFFLSNSSPHSESWENFPWESMWAATSTYPITQPQYVI